MNSWFKGELLSRLLVGVGKVFKVYVCDLVFFEDFIIVDDGSKSNRGRMLMYIDILEMGVSF